MKRRLKKLGIDPEADPNSLTAEEIKRFVRLDVDEVLFVSFFCIIFTRIFLNSKFNSRL